MGEAERLAAQASETTPELDLTATLDKARTAELQALLAAAVMGDDQPTPLPSASFLAPIK